MSSRRRQSHPTMFPNVLQAICDLQDSRGSTIRKIVTHLQTATSKKSTKARNVVMQVQRALKHGVQSGVLRHKAGKYMLSFAGPCQDNDCYKNRGRKKGEGKCRPAKGKKCKPRNRKQQSRRKRKPCRRSKSSSDSKGGSCTSRSRDTSAEAKVDEVVIPGRPKRRATKMKKVERPQVAKKRPRTLRNSIARKLRRPKRLPRKTSPEPVEVTDNHSEDNDMEDMANQENNGNLNTDDNNSNNNEQQEAYEEYMQQHGNSIPECNNPECLCNLKQEPDEDSAFENNFDGRPPFL